MACNFIVFVYVCMYIVYAIKSDTRVSIIANSLSQRDLRETKLYYNFGCPWVSRLLCEIVGASLDEVNWSAHLQQKQKWSPLPQFFPSDIYDYKKQN